MPELPEVHTTVEGLRGTIVGKTIKKVWSDFHLNTAHGERKNIKNGEYFVDFKKQVVGARIIEIERIGKNIVINLSNKNSIIVHMKMTGHLMAGKFDKYIHFLATLTHGKYLALSDMRKFASVCVEKTASLTKHEGLSALGPDPLRIKTEEFMTRIRSKKAPIKSALLDQTVLSGIGNIYSDEILWASSVHPLSNSAKIPLKILSVIYVNTKKILKKSIELGGDSMSDYRNAFGEKGGFQNFHQAYRRTGLSCGKRHCRGIIKRMIIRGRSAHFCPTHQQLYG